MAAPKKNLYALGNNGGRPPHYKTAEELEKKVIEYFDKCVEDKEMPTVTAMALFLGFSSLTSFYDYSHRAEEFSNVIKRARLCVAVGYEKNLDSFKYGGAIFALTNIDKDNWKNAKSTDITSGGEKINNSIDLSKLSDETLAAIEADITSRSKEGKV